MKAFLDLSKKVRGDYEKYKESLKLLMPGWNLHSNRVGPAPTCGYQHRPCLQQDNSHAVQTQEC